MEKILVGGGKSPLQKDGILHFPKFFQQFEIVHIAGANLKDVDVRNGIEIGKQDDRGFRFLS